MKFDNDGRSTVLQSVKRLSDTRILTSRLTVCDRSALQAAACGCYGRVEAFTEAVAARNI